MDNISTTYGIIVSAIYGFIVIKQYDMGQAISLALKHMHTQQSARELSTAGYHGR